MDRYLDVYLSILSQLQPFTPLNGVFCETTFIATFNSFPVAAGSGGSLRWSCRRGLSILSQLQRAQLLCAPPQPAVAFQFFPSCSPRCAGSAPAAAQRLGVLSILSQLQPKISDATNAATIDATFNSFPVAARARAAVHRDLRGLLSILSQLQHGKRRAGVQNHVHRFQFFPSCSN
jgi:hypothetical protein